MDDSLVDDVDQMQLNPLDFFCSSIDTLRGTSIDQTIPPNSGWSSRPTKLSGVGNAANDREELQAMCRKGIPPSLRCATWIINIVSAANPSLSKPQCDEYGTLMKSRILDHGWEIVVKSIFPDESDLDRAKVLDFGVGGDNLMNILSRDHAYRQHGCENGGCGTAIPGKGLRSLTMVMHAARDSLGIEFCPMLPDVTCLLLSYMPESYAYATIRQMVVDDSNYFLAVSRVQHLAFCKTFCDLMKRCFPQTATVMEQIGALSPVGLDPILKRFFVPLLRRKHVLRVMDIYTGEGIHAVFRIGTTLCCLSHAHLGESIRQNCDNAAVFWEGVRRFAHSRHFKFDIFLEHQAYGVQKSFRLLTRPIFPYPEFVARLVSTNESWAEEHQSSMPIHEETKPLGLVEGKIPIVLAKHSPERLSLAQWLPPVLQSTKIDLIYSSDHHGRSVEMFYRACSAAKHTITVMEVLGTDAVVGMYATQKWHNNPEGYGDGECFLFRLKPDPQCFKYRNESRNFHSFDESVDVSGHTEDTGQFMISSDTFISMGVGEDGASGLRLNEDLTRASVSKSVGFDNQGLVGEGVQVFEVGLVEVYRFLRDVDNKPVDGEADPWKDLFD